MELTPGTYKAQAVDFDFGFTRTGNEQVAVLFRVLDGDCKDETITWYGSLSDSALKYTMKSLQTMGWKCDDVSTMTVKDISNHVQLVLEEDTYNGITSLKVKWINPFGVALKERMSTAQKKALSERIKFLLGGGNGRQAPADDDGEMPF